MMWTDNPVFDAEEYYSGQERDLQDMPVCGVCGEHIQGKYCYSINDEIICEHCMVEYFRHETTDFME